MRIHRDVRFSGDKRPYKTNVGIQFRHVMGKDVHAPGFYFHMEPGVVFVGAGLWRPEPEPLAQIRDAIVAQPERWRKICSDPDFADDWELGGDSLKRPPRGYAADHPLIEDLKRRDFIAAKNLTAREIYRRGLPDRLAASFAATAASCSFSATRSAFRSRAPRCPRRRAARPRRECGPTLGATGGVARVIDAWNDVPGAPGFAHARRQGRELRAGGPELQRHAPRRSRGDPRRHQSRSIGGRTYTAGKADYPAVHKIQDQYKLIPLSQWKGAGTHYTPPASVPVKPGVDAKTPVPVQVFKLSAEQYFGRLCELLINNPAREADAAGHGAARQTRRHTWREVHDRRRSTPPRARRSTRASPPPSRRSATKSRRWARWSTAGRIGRDAAQCLPIARRRESELSDMTRAKMATEIQAAITMPDRVETRLGTLRFTDGFPDDATVEKVFDNLDFQHAVQAFLTTMPAASLNAMPAAARGFGPDNQTVIIFESLMDSRSLYLTANTESIYAIAWLDLEHGPIVVESPPNTLGLVDDFWFRYVTDLGIAGPDQGKGGKFLFLPPDFTGTPPDGYYTFKSPNLRQHRSRRAAFK